MSAAGRWLLAALAALAVACWPASAADPPWPPVRQSTPPGPAAARVPRPLPKVTSEPRIGVLLATGPEVSLTLPNGGEVAQGGRVLRLPAGELRVRATGLGLLTSATGNILLGEAFLIQVPAGDGPSFTATLEPPFGKPQSLGFAGQPALAIDKASRKALLIERTGLEQYLRGVITTEINPDWPLEAIKAQAVAARSYTLDRYLTNLDAPWQVHWHYTVDMAYGGLKPVPRRAAVALRQTWGQVIAASGLPVPALFHACSGGRTESARNFRPDLTAADNVMDMTGVMPSVADPDAATGARALGLAASHLDWRAEIPLPAVTTGLQAWAAAHPEDRLRFGAVQGVSIAERFQDSGRVATVTVRHLEAGREVATTMPAADFRLAIGPVKVRSVDWKRCVVASAKGGILVVEGRGYGHGVGLSQVSAWQMARTGSTAGEILDRFYPGADLVQWW